MSVYLLHQFRKKLDYVTLLAFICLMFYGCASPTRGLVIPNRKYHFPPSKTPVEIHEGTPTKAFIVVGEVQAHADLFSNKDAVMEELKKQAAKIGANVVINIEYSERTNELFGKGKAIRWK